MPHTIKLAPEHYTGLRPHNRAERRSLLKVALIVLLAFAATASFWLLQQYWRNVRELTWASANGTIQDVRPILVTKVDSARGGAMLYDVQVLATYLMNDRVHEQWITVTQRPASLGDEQLQALRLKGRKCIVRWQPSHPNQPVVELY